MLHHVCDCVCVCVCSQVVLENRRQSRHKTVSDSCEDLASLPISWVIYILSVAAFLTQSLLTSYPSHNPPSNSQPSHTWSLVLSPFTPPLTNFPDCLSQSETNWRDSEKQNIQFLPRQDQPGRPHAHTCTHTCIHEHTHSHTHSHTHTHTHTHTHSYTANVHLCVQLLQVVAVQDCSSIYRVPLLLQDQGVLEFFLKRLEMPTVIARHGYLHKWRNLADRWGQDTSLHCIYRIAPNFWGA